MRARRWFSRAPCEWRTCRHWCSCHWHYLNRTRIIILFTNSEFEISRFFWQIRTSFTCLVYFLFLLLLFCLIGYTKSKLIWRHDRFKVGKKYVNLLSCSYISYLLFSRKTNSEFSQSTAKTVVALLEFFAKKICLDIKFVKIQNSRKHVMNIGFVYNAIKVSKVILLLRCSSHIFTKTRTTNLTFFN